MTAGKYTLWPGQQPWGLWAGDSWHATGHAWRGQGRVWGVTSRKAVSWWAAGNVPCWLPVLHPPTSLLLLQPLPASQCPDLPGMAMPVGRAWPALGLGGQKQPSCWGPTECRDPGLVGNAALLSDGCWSLGAACAVYSRGLAPLGAVFTHMQVVGAAGADPGVTDCAVWSSWLSHCVPLGGHRPCGLASRPRVDPHPVDHQCHPRQDCIESDSTGVGWSF